VDTFRPLHLTADAERMEKEYMRSWMEGTGE